MSSQMKRNVSSSSTLKSEEPAYWTDDLPVCSLSAVGFSTNQIYRKDGHRREGHEFEDRSCHFRVEDELFLYGVFDGHDGWKAANFAAQRMPAELLLGQLDNKHTDDEIREVLLQAFVSVEKGWVESIDDALAKKARLLLEIPEGVGVVEAQEQYSEVLTSLEAVESDIRGGTTAVVALILHNKLYVANIGCSRALLCTSDEQGMLRVSQLTVDHDLNNEEEMARLADLGIDTEELRLLGRLGGQHYTRTLGDYSTKSGYREIHAIRTARQNPLLAEPEVLDGISLDSSCCFLLLFSDGLYEAIESATGTNRVNSDIASMVASEFAVQSTLNGVAQAVVDKVVRIHHDTFISDISQSACQQRDDITLLVRNFNYPLPNAVSSPPAASMATTMLGGGRGDSQGGMAPLSVVIPTSPSQQAGPELVLSNRPWQASVMGTLTHTLGGSSTMGTNYTSSTNDSTHSSGEAKPQKVTLSLDADNRIRPYVDFSALNSALDALTEEERAAFQLKPGYVTIPEEEAGPDGQGAGPEQQGAGPDEQGAGPLHQGAGPQQMGAGLTANPARRSDQMLEQSDAGEELEESGSGQAESGRGQERLGAGIGESGRSQVSNEQEGAESGQEGAGSDCVDGEVVNNLLVREEDGFEVVQDVNLSSSDT